MTGFGGANPVGGSGSGSGGGGFNRPYGGPPRPQNPAPVPPAPHPGNGGFGGPPPGPPNPFGSGGQFQPAQPGGYPPGPSGPPPPGYATPQSPKSRRKLVAIIGGAVIAVVAVVAGVITFTGGGSAADTTTASGAVRAYLEALAAGDAEKALSFSAAEPDDKTFLTDEVLKKQLEKAPISDIQVIGETGRSVHVLVKFGDTETDEEITVNQGADGAWKLEHGAYALDFHKDADGGGNALLDTVTIFGKPLPASGRAFLFPGAVEVGNSNPNITFKLGTEAHLLDVFKYGSFEKNADWKIDVSEEGIKGANAALDAFLAECAKSTTLDTPNCPNSFNDKYISYDIPPDARAQWTAPTNTDEVTLTPDGATGRAKVNGPVKFKLTSQSSVRQWQYDDFTKTAYVYGTVDLTKTPPTYQYSPGP